MHGPEIRTEALRLVAAGVNDCEIARRLGVARTTIRDWRRPRYVSRLGRCPRCWHRIRLLQFSDQDYAELLGLYLGDGHISKLARTQRLRICLDSKYPTIVSEADALLRRCFPQNPVGRVLFHDGAEVVLHVYSAHLSCLFRNTDLARSTTAALPSRNGNRRSLRRPRGPSFAAAFAPTAASSSTGPGDTST